MTIVRLAWLVGVALFIMVANVAVSILYMVVYSYVIDPGHEEQYYRDHIQVAAPYCSIVAGIPLMFLAGWWVGGWWEGEFAIKAALTRTRTCPPRRPGRIALPRPPRDTSTAPAERAPDSPTDSRAIDRRRIRGARPTG